MIPEGPSDLLLGQKNEGRGKVKEAERVEKWMKMSESERRGEGKEKHEPKKNIHILNFMRS